MRVRSTAFAALAAATMLSACTSYRGAHRIHDDRDTRSVEVARIYGVRQIFMDDLERMLTKRGLNRTANQGEIVVDFVPRQTDPAEMKRLLNSGFSLVRLYCNEYFNEMGRNQRNSAVLRDLIKPLTDAVNLVIGLKLLSDKENVNSGLVTGFAGLSSAASSGLTIYDRHFLFDNDNIAAVRSMTMTALADNRAAVYKSQPDDVVLAIGQLQENENICTPAQILSNVRETIKKGDFQTKPSGANQPTPPVTPPAQPGTGTVPPGSESFATTPAG